MHQKEIDKLKRSKTLTHCYIRKGGYYYRSNSQGYTEYVHDAGVYSKLDAIERAEKCQDLVLIPINVSDHNRMIVNKIKAISQNLI